jgi:hypothetical protein
MIDHNLRVTPKFRNSTNFKNVLDFLVEYDSSSFTIINDVNNLDSEYGFILDEIGKTLGAFPRPFVPKTIDGLPTIFTYDLSKYDSVPYGELSGSYRPMSNFEYSKILRVFAKGINFRGTIQEWEDIVFILTGVKSYFSNAASKFGIIVQKDLDITEKAIVEYALRYNSLTVNIDYIGTTVSETPFTYDVAPYNTSAYVTPW